MRYCWSHWGWRDLVLYPIRYRSLFQIVDIQSLGDSRLNPSLADLSATVFRSLKAGHFTSNDEKVNAVRCDRKIDGKCEGYPIFKLGGVKSPRQDIDEMYICHYQILYPWKGPFNSMRNWSTVYLKLGQPLSEWQQCRAELCFGLQRMDAVESWAISKE